MGEINSEKGVVEGGGGPSGQGEVAQVDCAKAGDAVTDETAGAVISWRGRGQGGGGGDNLCAECRGGEGES